MYPTKYVEDDGSVNYSKETENMRYYRPTTACGFRNDTNLSADIKYRPATATPYTQSIKNSIKNLNTYKIYEKYNTVRTRSNLLKNLSVTSSDRSYIAKNNNLDLKVHPYDRNKQANRLVDNKLDQVKDVKELHGSGKYDMNNTYGVDRNVPYNSIENQSSYTPSAHTIKYYRPYSESRERFKNIKEKYGDHSFSKYELTKPNACENRTDTKCIGCCCNRSNKPCMCHLTPDSDEHSNNGDKPRVCPRYVSQTKINKYVNIKNDNDSYTPQKTKPEDVKIDYDLYNKLYEKYKVDRDKNINLCYRVASKTDRNKNYNKSHDEMIKPDKYISNVSNVYAKYSDRKLPGKIQNESNSYRRCDETTSDINKNDVYEQFSQFTSGKHDFKFNRGDRDKTNFHDSKTDVCNQIGSKKNTTDDQTCKTDRANEIRENTDDSTINLAPIKNKTKYTDFQKSQGTTKESLVKKFDRIVDEELRRRKDSVHVMLEPTTNDPEILQAIDCYIRAENLDTFTGAVRAAEEAAAKAQPGDVEEAAVQGAKGFQAEVIDVIDEQLPGWIPIKVIGYVGITKPKRPVKTVN